VVASVRGNRRNCAVERSHCSCTGCSGGPTPRSMAFLHSSGSPSMAVALPHFSSSASCTFPLFGVSLLHFPVPRRRQLLALRHPFCIVCLLRIVPSGIQFCFHRHLLCSSLSPVLPTIRFGVGCAPGDSCPGPGRLCSIRPPPAGHSDLDVDANYTALTPRPRLSSASSALLITSPIVTCSCCSSRYFLHSPLNPV
jgi:hypothetical protein